MSVSEADRVKLQLLGIYTWDSFIRGDDRKSLVRWKATYGELTSKWVYHRGHDGNHPSKDMRLKAATEEELVKLILENLK